MRDKMRRPTRRVAQVSLTYLLLTVGVFCATNDLEVSLAPSLFAVACYLALGLGWMGSVSREVGGTPARTLGLRFWLLPVASLLVSFNAISAYYSGFDMVLSYLASPGEAYEYVKLVRSGRLPFAEDAWSNSYLGLGLTMLGWTRMAAVAVAVVKWSYMTTRMHTIYAVAVAAFLVETLLMGAMVNIAVGGLAALSGLMCVRKEPGRRSLSTAFWIVFVSLVGLFGGIYFVGSRGQGEVPGFSALSAGWESLVFYVTHGYIGLGLCLELPFMFSWGQGAFRGIAGLWADMLPSVDARHLTYLARSEAQTGWSASQLWSTAFPWWASDFTFVLCPLFMIILGWLLRRVLDDALATGSLPAVLLLAHLLVAVLLLPANNFLFHTVGNGVATIILLFNYLVWRHRCERSLDSSILNGAR